MIFLVYILCLFAAGCYGVDPANVSKDWKCARCRANAMTEVRTCHWLFVQISCCSDV